MVSRSTVNIEYFMSGILKSIFNMYIHDACIGIGEVDEVEKYINMGTMNMKFHLFPRG